MKRTIRTIFVFIIFAAISTACAKQNVPGASVTTNTPSSKVYFKEPDKIVIHKNGNTQTIALDNKLFSGIVSKMNDRADKYIDVFRLGFDENNMKTTKQNEIVVEFIYSKSQKSKFGTIEKQYNNLIFPLTGENLEFCFFDNGKGDYSGPIGSLNNSESLLDMLK